MKVLAEQNPLVRPLHVRVYEGKERETPPCYSEPCENRSCECQSQGAIDRQKENARLKALATEITSSEATVVFPEVGKVTES